MIPVCCEHCSREIGQRATACSIVEFNELGLQGVGIVASRWTYICADCVRGYEATVASLPAVPVQEGEDNRGQCGDEGAKRLDGFTTHEPIAVSKDDSLENGRRGDPSAVISLAHETNPGGLLSAQSGRTGERPVGIVGDDAHRSPHPDVWPNHLGWWYAEQGTLAHCGPFKSREEAEAARKQPMKGAA